MLSSLTQRMPTVNKNFAALLYTQFSTKTIYPIRSGCSGNRSPGISSGSSASSGGVRPNSERLLDIRRTMSGAPNAGFRLEEIDGDLFSALASYSLAHCVGADLAMGAGIAVKFKQLYGRVPELRAQKAPSGGVAVLKDQQRYIYYLVTKEKSWGSPTYDSLRSSLMAMRQHMLQHKVDKLAMPRIGCGIDGLQWDKVSGQLEEVFGADDLQIVVYNFVPK